MNHNNSACKAQFKHSNGLSLATRARRPLLGGLIMAKASSAYVSKARATCWTGGLLCSPATAEWWSAMETAPEAASWRPASWVSSQV